KIQHLNIQLQSKKPSNRYDQQKVKNDSIEPGHRESSGAQVRALEQGFGLSQTPERRQSPRTEMERSNYSSPGPCSRRIVEKSMPPNIRRSHRDRQRPPPIF